MRGLEVTCRQGDDPQACHASAWRIDRGCWRAPCIDRRPTRCGRAPWGRGQVRDGVSGQLCASGRRHTFSVSAPVSATRSGAPAPFVAPEVRVRRSSNANQVRQKREGLRPNASTFCAEWTEHTPRPTQHDGSGRSAAYPRAIRRRELVSRGTARPLSDVQASPARCAQRLTRNFDPRSSRRAQPPPGREDTVSPPIRV